MPSMAAMATNATDGLDPKIPRRLDLRMLATRYGTSPRWWRTHLPDLLKLKLVRKRGKLYFGRLADVDAWLSSQL